MHEDEVEERDARDRVTGRTKPLEQSSILGANPIYVKPVSHHESSKLPAPSLESSDYRAWHRAYSLVRAWMLNSMSKELVRNFNKSTTAREMWQSLEKHFGKAEHSHLMKGTYALSITEYYLKVDTFLCGLNDSYGVTRNVILSCLWLSLEVAYGMMLNVETNHEKDNAVVGSALVAKPSSSGESYHGNANFRVTDPVTALHASNVSQTVAGQNLSAETDSAGLEPLAEQPGARVSEAVASAFSDDGCFAAFKPELSGMSQYPVNSEMYAAAGLGIMLGLFLTTIVIPDAMPEIGAIDFNIR
ncbi:hypothetical protein M569_00261 [Genlisea aurea]|uniref:Retrotransposon Copia-like N-terminal domain-containing protein n=1 Tax=Genlisea aurea TaxID=192259 RepID=S8D508_9LAMI|nr:hypothetical protein M569_00261 [Genlisea aurea]